MRFDVRSTLALPLLLLAGCGGNSATDPRFEPEIVNSVDSFEFQVTDIADVTETLQYTWTNTGTSATVDRSSSLSAGSGTLTILDAEGVQVFSAPVTTESAGSTSAGTAGAWTIRVVFENAAGTVNFRVQKGG